MSIARYKRLTRILNTIIIFLACFPVILLVLCALDALSLSWTIIFPIMAFVLSFLLQNYCTNLHVFFLCNLLYAAIPLAIWLLAAGLPAHFPGAVVYEIDGTVNLLDLTSPRILLTLFYIAFAVAMFVGNFVIKLHHPDNYLGSNIPLAVLGVPILVQIASLSLHTPGLSFWILAGAVLQILLYFYNKYLLQYIGFLEEVKTSVDVPLGQISTSNGWLLAVFFLISTFLMTIICLLPLEHLLPSLITLFFDGFRAVLMFIFWLLRIEESQGESTEPPLENIHQDFGTEESSLLAEIIGKVIFFVLIAAAIIGALTLLIYLILLLVKTFYSQRTLASDRVEFLNPFDHDKKEKLTPESRPEFNFWNRLFGSSPEQRIRKAWYRMIRNHIPDVPAQLAPFELSQDISHNELEQQSAKELSDLYEKARYSGQICTKEDVNAAKQLAGKLKSKAK